MKKLFNFIQSTTNFVTLILSVSLSLFFWLFQPSQKVPLIAFIVSIFLCFFLLWALINSLFALKESPDSKQYTQIIICDNSMCLCNKHSSLTHGIFVTLYLLQNSCEHQIGYGEVINIQDNGLVSIDIHPLKDTIVSNEPLPFYQIVNNHKDEIRIKPLISRKIINEIQNVEENLHGEVSNSQN